MQYYKTENDGVVLSINTVNADGNGNITADEYEQIKLLFAELPSGMQIIDHGDGTYSYEEAPPQPESDIEPEEIVDILMGVET